MIPNKNSYYTTKHGLNEEATLQESMKEKTTTFVASGGEIYQGEKTSDALTRIDD
jgi:hypothetical protein